MNQAALTREQIDELHSLLESRGNELRILLEQAADLTRPVTLDQQSVGRVSRIDAIQQQQMAIASQTQTSRMLRSIEAALRRIEEGEYGDCRQCGEPILFARLQIQPEASLCVTCQSENESS